jgi:hypothetical protein
MHTLERREGMRTGRLLLVLALFTSLGLGTVATGTAVAQDGPDYVGNTPPEGGSEVSGGGDSAGASDNGLLPVTGGDIALMLAVAIAAIGLGWVLMHNVRTRRSSAVVRQ